MEFVKEIRRGDIFIYPTDTIYGLGCNAENPGAVEKIQEIKGRDFDKPLSVIAPSKQWILDNCIVTKNFLDKYLPGPYTLVLKKKKHDFLKWLGGADTIGVRIPDHSFMDCIRGAKVPFVTTSVNLSGEPFARKIDDIDSSILGSVDFVIDDGELSGNPSILVVNGKEIKR